MKEINLKEVFSQILNDSPKEIITFLVYQPLLNYINDLKFKSDFVSKRKEKNIEIISLRLNQFSSSIEDNSINKKILNVNSSIKSKFSAILWKDNCFLYNEENKRIVKVINKDNLDTIRNNLLEIINLKNKK